MRPEVKKIQNVMKKQKLTMYLVPTSDEHQSEYIPEAYKFRAYLSGFTGSAGILLITENDFLLWTDGRYYIQAEKQLENSGIILISHCGFLPECDIILLIERSVMMKVKDYISASFAGD